MSAPTEREAESAQALAATHAKLATLCNRLSPTDRARVARLAQGAYLIGIGDGMRVQRETDRAQAALELALP